MSQRSPYSHCVRYIKIFVPFISYKSEFMTNMSKISPHFNGMFGKKQCRIKKIIPFLTNTFLTQRYCLNNFKAVCKNVVIYKFYKIEFRNTTKKFSFPTDYKSPTEKMENNIPKYRKEQQLVKVEMHQLDGIRNFFRLLYVEVILFSDNNKIRL